MRKAILFIVLTTTLTACNGWGVQPLPYNPPTPIVIPTRTPSIYTPTPVSFGNTDTPPAPTDTITPTLLPSTATSTEAPANTSTPINSSNVPALQIIVLGCNTSIDITHGMGEVTNAFVTLKNTGAVELTNLIATLYALDEGREHPDKVQEVSSIPVGFEIMLKMTVDSTYKQESPIQVEVTSNQMVFPREGIASCRDIGLFAPKPETLNMPVPSNP